MPNLAWKRVQARLRRKRRPQEPRPDPRAGKRVLIFSASAGSGHVRAAEALVEAFGADPRTGAVEHRDALDFSNKLYRDLYSDLYDTLVRSAPSFLGWWYRTSDEPWKTDPVRLWLDRLNAAPLVQFIRDFRPDVTVCTHFMPAGIISNLIARKRLDAHLSIVVTDLDIHAMWLQRTFHRYFVALEETRVHLETLGFNPDRITVSGIPVTSPFTRTSDRRQTLLSLGLSDSPWTLLVSAGALGAGPAELVAERILALRHPFQAIVVCGRNQPLQIRLERKLGRKYRNFRFLGYTSEMAALMQASHLFIGKPGGLTTAEALATGLPMAIVSPIPGQEERNSDHLLEKGVAIKCNDLTVIPYKIDALLDDPARLASMRANALQLGRPRASQTIATTLLEDNLPPARLPEATRNEMTRRAGRRPR